MIDLRRRIKLLESRAESATPPAKTTATALPQERGDDRVPAEQIEAKARADHHRRPPIRDRWTSCSRNGKLRAPD